MYNEFQMVDALLDSEYLNSIENDAERFRNMDKEEFIIEIRNLDLPDLEILFDLSFRWHDEELIKRIKKELRNRGVIWV